MNARASLAIGFALLLSCSPMPGGPSDARSSIETLLQKRTAAVVANDADAFRSTVDGARPALRRTQQDLFDAMRARMSGGSTMTKVLKVEAYGAYTRAYVDDSPELMLLGVDSPPTYKRVYFRQEGGTWLLTEPKVDELGALKHDRIGDIDIEHWAIDDDIVGAVAAEMAAQRAAVAQMVPSGALPPISLRLYPTAETIGLAGIPDAAAAHSIVLERDATLRIYDLWWTAGPGDVSAFSQFVFRDQLLGMARERLAPLAYLRMDWWLRHGLGLATSGPDVGGAVRDLCAEPLTWTQMFAGPQKDTMGGGEMMGGDALAPTYQRFMSSTTPRAFVQARSMIEYLRAAKGERAYWDLVLAYQKESGPSIAYATALGVTPERFYSDWLAWAKARC